MTGLIIWLGDILYVLRWICGLYLLFGVVVSAIVTSHVYEESEIWASRLLKMTIAATFLSVMFFVFAPSNTLYYGYWADYVKSTDQQDTSLGKLILKKAGDDNKIRELDRKVTEQNLIHKK